MPCTSRSRKIEDTTVILLRSNCSNYLLKVFGRANQSSIAFYSSLSHVLVCVALPQKLQVQPEAFLKQKCFKRSSCLCWQIDHKGRAESQLHQANHQEAERRLRQPTRLILLLH